MSGEFAHASKRRPSRLPDVELIVGGATGVIILAILVLKDILPLRDPYVGSLLDRFKPVGSIDFPLGTDNLGRDLLARVIEGGVWSVSVAMTATLMSCLLGTALGLLAARRDGLFRNAINWLVDATLSFPTFVLAIIIVAVLGHGFWPMTLTLALILWPGFARVVLAESLAVLQAEYVVSARLFGRGEVPILIGHVLPALVPSLSVMLPFVFAEMLIAESGLSFLGLGAPLGVPTWGNMLQEARDYLLIAPWMMAVPAGGIVLVVMIANLIGDGIGRFARHTRPQSI